ncbi:MAG: outer membrane beta-barrel protein [Hyphomicrobiales bacterium]
MSRFLKVGIVALSATALSSVIAIAADLDPPAPVIEHKPVVAAAGGGFYLRGDIGYSIWSEPDTVFQNDVAGFSSGFDNENAENALVFGGGVGYKFRKYLRFDLTADHRTNKDLDGTIECGACLAFPTIGDRTLGLDQTLDLSTFFANAYIDAGSFGGFTPYVGGGVGFAYLNYGTFISSNNPTAGNTPGGDPLELAQANPSGEANQLFEGEDDLRFAWNLQAGLSYELNDNLALDGSYRYTRINGGDVAQTAVGPIVSDDLDGHELRIGLRYTFGGAKPSYQAPSPIFK